MSTTAACSPGPIVSVSRCRSSSVKPTVAAKASSVKPAVAAVRGRAVEAEEVGGGPPARIAEQRVEVELVELAGVVAREHPRVDHADQAAAAQLGDLRRDLAVEALRGLEADDEELERAEAGLVDAIRGG